MQNIRSPNGEELNSTYSFETVDNVFGLVLESWGPKDRNPDYARAMEQILSRLIENELPYINVYVVSRNLTRAFPRLEDRSIKINGSKNIGLRHKDATDLRLAIGREVSELKEHSSVFSKGGGNRFKRVLLHSPLLSEIDWNAIALTNAKLKIFEPTADKEKLERIVDALHQQEIDMPEGSINPKQSSVTTTAYFRDPLVKAWVLKNANGFCEACLSSAPFKREDGSPYLEVHHLVPLSEGGADTINNALAVCPNCHRQLHHGEDKACLIADIRSKVSRLE